MEVKYYENMSMNDKKRVTIDDARGDFDGIVTQAEENGHVYIYENNEPRYMVIDLEKEPQIEMSEDEKFEFVVKRLLREHKRVFTELAK